MKTIILDLNNTMIDFMKIKRTACKAPFAIVIENAEIAKGFRKQFEFL